MLATARDLGFTGPTPEDLQIERSLAYAAIIHPVSRALDLGSGGGLPGLVLVAAWPATEWCLVDSSQKRTDWLKRAAASLGVTSRCHVICDRAENLGRGPLRTTFDLVTARSFGPPGATAECAAPFLKLGGELVVADPPDPSAGRWPRAGLEHLGLVHVSTEAVATAAGPVTLSRLTARSVCPDRFPRRVGVPFKRLLF